MSDALELMRAVLAHACPDDVTAAAIFEAALERETDPLVYCSTAGGVEPTLAMERAARWAGFAFYARIPQGLKGHAEPGRPEALAEVRLFRVTLLDREVAFAAPDLYGQLRLRPLLDAMPELRKRICLVPEQALRAYLVDAASETLTDGARQNLARRWPYASAQLELTGVARYGFLVGLILLLGLVMLAPYMAQPWLLPLALSLLLGPTVVRLAAVLAAPEPPPPATRPPDEELPVYSVLIPLRNEAAMVPQLFQAMSALDYPPDRLDIKFVVETDSPATIAAVEVLPEDPRFSLVPVPDARPRTKPKALDFALPLCRGEFVVVYDAEDIPEPGQLWQAAARFRDAPEVTCLQARLVIDNGRENWLTALFAGEYAGLFGVLLPALARWRLPMPLGGTSNHFRLAALRELGGWDAFNVTEDADLGTRLARRRHRVETLASATRETAPSRLLPWHGQRTRWMKGWMQTFIVHNRDPGRLLREMGPRAMLAFEILVLGMITAPILHIGFSVSLLIQLLTGRPWFDESGWSLLYLLVLATGYGSALALTTVGLARLRRLDLLARQILLPVYWLLIAAATIRALRDLVLRPFYWFKSPHEPLPRGSPGR